MQSSVSSISNHLFRETNGWTLEKYCHMLHAGRKESNQKLHRCLTVKYKSNLCFTCAYHWKHILTRNKIFLIEIWNVIVQCCTWLNAIGYCVHQYQPDSHFILEGTRKIKQITVTITTNRLCTSDCTTDKIIRYITSIGLDPKLYPAGHLQLGQVFLDFMLSNLLKIRVIGVFVVFVVPNHT